MKKLIIIGLFFLILPFTSMAQIGKVAILEPNGNIENHFKSIVREEIYSTVTNIDRYSVLDRQEVNNILAENKIQVGAVIAESQMSDLGQKMGVDFVLITTASTVGTDNFSISCKMINVNNAQVEKQNAAQTRNGMADLVGTVQNVVREMLMTETEKKALEERKMADLQVEKEKEMAEQKAREERAIVDSVAKANKKLANQNMNGHYISLGSSFVTSGCYGKFGLGYEYRYHILGVNVSVGFGGNNIWMDNDFLLIGNAGLKLYLANKKNFLRNFYFNMLPFCYMGQEKNSFIEYKAVNNTIVEVINHQYSHLLGVGLFIGYSPVWHVSKKVSLGFNVDMGVKANYKFNKWFPINFDLGFVVKFDN